MRMMTRIAAAAAAFAMMSLPAAAQMAPSSDPASVQAGVYNLETSHARVLFGVSHFGFSTWYGDLPGATGVLNLDPADVSKTRLEVSIPVASLSTTNAKLDDELKGPQWFNAQAHPTITFRSTTVERTGPSTAKVTGDLTFRGVTRPVTLEASFRAFGQNPMNKAYTVGFEVRGKIRRSDFGFNIYVPAIGDEVELIISAPFEKAG